MRRSFLFGGLCAGFILVLTGCGHGGGHHSRSASGSDVENFNGADARAESDLPAASEVTVVAPPADPSLPRFVVRLDPFEVKAAGVTSGGGNQILYPGDIGAGISAQLVTLLLQSPNFVVVENSTPAIGKGEVGPFVISGTVTEFNEIADSSGSGKSSSRRGLGRVIGIVPYVGGLAGHLVGASKSRDQKTSEKLKGMVAFDIKISDERTGRVIGAFTSHGTFVTTRATSTVTKWGKTTTETRGASSAIG